MFTILADLESCSKGRTEEVPQLPFWFHRNLSPGILLSSHMSGPLFPLTN